MSDVRILGLILMPHVVLLLLVTREDADLLDVRPEEPPEDRIARTPGPPGNHQYFVVENGHIYLYKLFYSEIPPHAY